MEEAARDHAAFLAELNRSRELLTRQVLIVIGDTPPGQQPHAGSMPEILPPLIRKERSRTAQREARADVVLRRADEAAHVLSVLGVAAHVLDADTCAEVLAECLTPGQDRLTGLADPDDLITALGARP